MSKSNQIQDLFNQAIQYQQQNNWQKAYSFFQSILRIQPKHFSSLASIGSIYLHTGHPKEALPYFLRAQAIHRDHPELSLALGTCYAQLQHWTSAETYLAQYVSAHPNHPAALFNLARAYRQLRRIDEAITCFHKAITSGYDTPETHCMLAEVYLISGCYKEGFREYEWRFYRQEAKELYTPYLSLPQWRGEPFSGKKLIVCFEQGLGDTIQFSRYLPIVKERGGHVTLLLQPELESLFHEQSFIDDVCTTLDPQQFDLSIPLLSLPHIFETNLDSLPNQVPYLITPANRAKPLKRLFQTEKIKVGIVWQGKIDPDGIPNRSCPLEALTPLTTIPHIQLYSLQIGDAGKQLSTSPDWADSIDLSPYLSDFADTAAAISLLDILISIDTSVPHLSGALGKPVWLLLPFNSEWRWMINTKMSPWYPTMTLFRQPSPGDWVSIIDEIYSELLNYDRR